MDTKKSFLSSRDEFISYLHSIEKESQVTALVDAILKGAVEWDASDIHLEPTHDSFWIRYRLDGVLQEIGSLKKSLSANIIGRVKILADLLTYRTDTCQESSIQQDRILHLLGDNRLNLRVSILPVLFGEKAVIRLLRLSSQGISLDSIGFPDQILDSVHSVCKISEGVLLFTGPAGSGKTTSIYATLSYLTSSTQGTKNVVTIEDPVECVIPGVTQSQVNPASGLNFSHSLRAMLRQDPEIIMVGEIRDPETAQIAIQAGLTGHFVISTVHSGRASAVFIRLMEMGIDPFLLRNSIQMVIAQRLVRILCPHCKYVFQGDLPSELVAGHVYEAGKCAICKNTGYQGRRVIVECLVVDGTIRNAISQRFDADALEEIACDHNMLSLRQRALDIVNDGITSFTEIQRVLPGMQFSSFR